jgi:hypothetical protein
VVRFVPEAELTLMCWFFKKHNRISLIAAAGANMFVFFWLNPHSRPGIGSCQRRLARSRPLRARASIAVHRGTIGWVGYTALTASVWHRGGRPRCKFCHVSG